MAVCVGVSVDVSAAVSAAVSAVATAAAAVVENAPRRDPPPARIMFFGEMVLRRGMCGNPEELLSPRPRLEMSLRTPPARRKL